jgi:hypothetical protein
VVPFFIGGPASMTSCLSPSLGAVLGAYFGIVGGALRDLSSRRTKEMAVMSEV